MAKVLTKVLRKKAMTKKAKINTIITVEKPRWGVFPAGASGNHRADVVNAKRGFGGATPEKDPLTFLQIR
jgi:hypothetical protein